MKLGFTFLPYLLQTRGADTMRSAGYPAAVFGIHQLLAVGAKDDDRVDRFVIKDHLISSKAQTVPAYENARFLVQFHQVNPGRMPKRHITRSNFPSNISTADDLSFRRLMTNVSLTLPWTLASKRAYD
jgi:hypothetical protein